MWFHSVDFGWPPFFSLSEFVCFSPWSFSSTFGHCGSNLQLKERRKTFEFIFPSFGEPMCVCVCSNRLGPVWRLRIISFYSKKGIDCVCVGMTVSSDRPTTKWQRPDIKLVYSCTFSSLFSFFLFVFISRFFRLYRRPQTCQLLDYTVAVFGPFDRIHLISSLNSLFFLFAFLVGLGVVWMSLFFCVCVCVGVADSLSNVFKRPFSVL